MRQGEISFKEKAHFLRNLPPYWQLTYGAVQRAYLPTDREQIVQWPYQHVFRRSYS